MCIMKGTIQIVWPWIFHVSLLFDLWKLCSLSREDTFSQEKDLSRRLQQLLSQRNYIQICIFSGTLGRFHPFLCDLHMFNKKYLLFQRTLSLQSWTFPMVKIFLHLSSKALWFMCWITDIRKHRHTFTNTQTHINYLFLAFPFRSHIHTPTHWML